MKVIKNLTAVLVFLALVFFVYDSSAQCAMCALSAEESVKNGNTAGKGLNTGILYLLAAPYLAVACIGLLWYKKYRKKNIPIHIKDERINLN
jgi:hypothetical protein